MSCSNCKKSFSIFCKEKSCKNCELAFCSRCITRKMIIPKSGNEGNVCARCEKLIIHQQSTRPPPDALQRRLEFLENPPASNPITVYTTSEKSRRMSNLKRGLSVEDQAIAERLEKLKNERKASMNIPTEAEMHQRLLKLKDVSNSGEVKESIPNTLLKLDNRSDYQMTKDLVEQANAEVQLENKLPKPEDEIQERLAKLRGQETKNRSEPMEIVPEDILRHDGALKQKNNTPVNMTDICKLLDEVAMDAENDANIAMVEFENDKELQEKFQNIMRQKSQQSKQDNKSDSEPEDEIENVVKSIMSEQKIEEKFKNEELTLPDVPTFIPTQHATARQIQRSLEDNDKELPWCTICNEDAIFRCVEGCEGDLYCSRCFRECHDEIDLKEHKKIEFKSK